MTVSGEIGAAGGDMRHALAPLVLEIWPSEEKAIDILLNDVSFLEALDALARMTDREGRRSAIGRLDEYAFILLKPDVAMAGGDALVLDFLAEHGFSCVAQAVLQFNELRSRTLWQYSFVGDDPVRMRIIDALLQYGPTTILFLRADIGGSACSRLSKLKGAANPAVRTGGTLRDVIGCPNTFLSGVHVPDTTIEMLRELPVLLDACDWSVWLRAAMGDETIAPVRTTISPAPPIREEGHRYKACASESMREHQDLWETIASHRAYSVGCRKAIDAIEQLLTDVSPQSSEHWRLIERLTYLFDGPLPIGGRGPASPHRVAAG